MTNQGSEPGKTTAAERRRFAFAGIEQRVLDRLRDLEPGAGATIVVGFSGGADSLCLAAMLARIADRARIRPILTHVNHRLRPSADDDAERCRELAARLGLPYEVRTIEGDLAILHPGAGIEEGARRERYRLLAGVAHERGARFIATAHHQQDQVETVLLHLFRGSGLRGVAGMAERASVSVPWWGETTDAIALELLRPLLPEPKHEIDAYVAKLDLEPVIDESNEDPRFRRNAIRHDILPAIDARFPAARAAIARFAGIAGAEDAFLDGLASSALKSCQTSSGGLRIDVLTAQPEVIQRRMALRWLRQRCGTPEIPIERVDATLELARDGSEEPWVEIAAGRSARVLGDELVCASDAGLLSLAWGRFAGPRAELPAGSAVELSETSTVQIGNVRFVLGGNGAPAGIEGIDWVRLPPSTERDRLWLRRVRSTDRFAGDGSSVREWLRVHNVPVAIRASLIAVTSGDAVLWIPGLPRPRAEKARTGRVVYWFDVQPAEG